VSKKNQEKYTNLQYGKVRKNLTKQVNFYFISIMSSANEINNENISSDITSEVNTEVNLEAVNIENISSDITSEVNTEVNLEAVNIENISSDITSEVNPEAVNIENITSDITSEVNTEISSEVAPFPRDRIKYINLQDELVERDSFSLYELMFLRDAFSSQEELDKFVLDNPNIPRITDRCANNGNYVKQYWHIQGDKNYCEFCYHNGCMDYTKVSNRSLLLKVNMCDCQVHSKHDPIYNQNTSLDISKKWCGSCQCPIPIYPHYYYNICKKCNVIGLNHKDHFYCVMCTPEGICVCGKEIQEEVQVTYLGCPGRNHIAKGKMYSVGTTHINELSFCEFCYSQGCWTQYERDFLDGKITIPNVKTPNESKMKFEFQPVNVKTADGKDETLHALVSVPDKDEKKENSKNGDTINKDGDTINKDGDVNNKDGDTINKDGDVNNKDGDTITKKISIVNTNNHRIDVDYKANYVGPHTVYSSSCDCYYHRDDKLAPKLEGNFIDRELIYCGKCDIKRSNHSNRICRNCKYFSCIVSTEYYCHHCAKELNICPCGNNLFAYEYKDYPEIVVARIHTSIGNLLQNSRVMLTPLILAFPEYIDLYTKKKEIEHQKHKDFMLKADNPKLEVDDKTISDDDQEHINELKSIREKFHIERSNMESPYPLVVSRHLIYDNYTEEIITHIEDIEASFSQIEEIKKEIKKEDKKVILEIRKVIVNIDMEWNFWIFSDDLRYRYLRTMMTDENCFSFDKIIEIVDSNKGYDLHGGYSCSPYIRIQKTRISSSEDNTDRDEIGDDNISDDNTNIKFEQNIHVLENYKNYYKVLSDLVSEKGTIKTEFSSQLPSYFTKEDNSVPEHIAIRLINNSLYLPLRSYMNLTLYLQPHELICLYQIILNYISFIGIVTDERGSYWWQKTELVCDSEQGVKDKSENKYHSCKLCKRITIEKINPNPPYPTDKGLLKIIELRLWLYSKYKELFPNRSEAETDRVLSTFRRTMLEESFYDRRSGVSLQEALSNKNEKEMFYNFLPLMPSFIEYVPDFNLNYVIKINERSKLIYSRKDIIRKLIMTANKSRFFRDYNCLAYTEDYVIIHSSAGWISLFGGDGYEMEVSMNEAPMNKFTNIMSNFVNLVKSSKLEKHIVVSCKKCKGYLTSYQYLYETKSYIPGNNRLSQTFTSPLCQCGKSLSPEEEKKKKEDELKKKCLESGLKCCQCFTCPVDSKGTKIKSEKKEKYHINEDNSEDKSNSDDSDVEEYNSTTEEM